jgi:hypothetical protein
MNHRILPFVVACNVLLIALTSCATTESLKKGQIATPTTVAQLVANDQLVGQYVSLDRCVYIPEKSFYALKAGHVGAAIYGGYDKMVMVIKDSVDALNYAELILSEAQYKEFRKLDPRSGDIFAVKNVLVKKVVGDDIGLYPLLQFSIRKVTE